MILTEGLIQEGWVAGGMGVWPVCAVWVDRWVEGEGKGGI